MKSLKLIAYSISLVMLIIIIIFSKQLLGYANEKQVEDQATLKWQHLNQLAEESLFLLQQKQIEASKKRIEELSKYFLTLNLGDYVERVDQAQIVTESLVQAQEAFNPVELQVEEVQKKLWKLRLTLDAVSHKNQPLWLHYYPKIMRVMDELVATIDHQDRDNFYYLLNQVNEYYQLVRPALIISHPMSVVVKLDSELDYIRNNSQRLWSNKKEAYSLFETLSADFKTAFFQANEQSSQSLFFLIIGIGTIICTVLGYVAWRKYKGEREKVKVIWTK